jgi:hypothetical protein
VIVDLSEADEKELNIRLNANTGEWDFDLLAGWDKQELQDWGLDLPEFDYNPQNKEKEIDEIETKNECPQCGYKW